MTISELEKLPDQKQKDLEMKKRCSAAVIADKSKNIQASMQELTSWSASVMNPPSQNVKLHLQNCMVKTRSLRVTPHTLKSSGVGKVLEDDKNWVLLEYSYQVERQIAIFRWALQAEILRQDDFLQSGQPEKQTSSQRKPATDAGPGLLPRHEQNEAARKASLVTEDKQLKKRKPLYSNWMHYQKIHTVQGKCYWSLNLTACFQLDSANAMSSIQL